MPTFATTKPISVDLWVNTGVVHLTAGAGTTTVVEVAPADAKSDSDRSAAAHTQVEYANGELTIKGPRKPNLFTGTGSIAVSVTVPAGSRLAGSTAMGGLYCEGELGDCSFKTEYGEIKVDRVGRLDLNSGYGDVVVGHATGAATIHTSSGNVRVGGVDGTLTLDNSNGRSEVQQISGPLTATSTNGDIIVGRAGDTVTARSSNGSIRIGEATRGRIDLTTSAGEVEVGIRSGAVAWLDVRTRSKTGSVRNSLGGSQAAAPAGADIEVHALTSSGDIVIRPA